MAAQLPTYSETAALSLSMAIVASSPIPVLLLDGDLKVVAMSISFSKAFGIDLADAAGRELASLGAGEWDKPQLRSLLELTRDSAVKVEVYELDLKRPGRHDRHLVVRAQRLVYLDSGNPRLLVAVSDMTEARANAKLNDETLRQNLVLLQEVRHRVANSLQIIASVLLQNAKQALSDETRGHLEDAHNRVMSVAALERQLAVSGDGAVELRAYFTKLCGSIVASMIREPEQLSLSVTGDCGVVDARVSVSLGLIVTELVINALKHAFPDGRRGKITVNCEVHGPNWSLSVTDDGIGMPSDPAQITLGLGTSIVQALASQLHASVDTQSAHPGTRVAMTYTQIALVDGAPERVIDVSGVKSSAA